MISNLKKTLGKSTKYKLWQDSYIYNLCFESFTNWLEAKSIKQKDSVKVFLKTNSKTISITIACSENNLLSWLKVSNEELEEYFTKLLISKDAMGSRNLELTFKKTNHL